MQHVSQVMKQAIPTMTFLRAENCKCGEKVEVYEMEIPIGPMKGQMIETRHGCKCEDLELAKKSMQSSNNLKMDKMREIFDRNSLINRDLQGASFDNFEIQSESQAKAKRIAERFVEVFDKDNPINLLFSGSYGVGKSHLAKSITDGVMNKFGTRKRADGREKRVPYKSIFISVPKLLTKFRSSYNKDSNFSEADLIKILSEVDVLVLDDLGAEKNSDWSWEKLFEIVDSRQGLHTIYTSNYNPEDLINKLGERNFSRVVNRDTTIVEIQSDNYRLGKFEKEPIENQGW